MSEKHWLLTTAPAGSRELLQKVAASAQFQKSKRLRDLLLYLGERSLHDPNCILHEQEIGVDVFDRRPDYDTSHDTLVRVQVSQLRKKLQDFFLAEGRDEPLIIDIPKGSYVPVFRPRTDLPPTPEPERPAVAAVMNRRPVWTGIAIGLAVMGLAWGISATAIRPAPGLRSESVVGAFWRQLFGNGQATYVALSDGTLIEFENLMGVDQRAVDGLRAAIEGG